ncbi:hypothetical protein ACIO52_04610 [Nocardia sp. NPDC087230]|uniref:hypothetical protein n=1 Tax=Nocardia sp. NPDC087230 TaxID=3364331 RepID=UPI0038032F34
MSSATRDDADELLGRVGEPLVISTPEIREDLVPQTGVVGATVGVPLHRQRYLLASRLLILVGVISVMLLAAVVFAPADRVEGVKTIGSVIYGPLITLLGTSFAFYYASRRD